MALQLWVTNLYKTGHIRVLPDGKELLLRDKVDYGFCDRDIVHAVAEDDVLDGIANTYYARKGDDPSKLWWYIADVSGIVDPFDLSDFPQVVVPDYSNIQRYVSNGSD